MTHEPECVAITKDDDLPEISPNDCLLCITSSTAYKRGREDAAKAVGELCSSNKLDEDGWLLFEHCFECAGTSGAYDMAIDDAIAAARGDGEKE